MFRVAALCIVSFGLAHGLYAQEAARPLTPDERQELIRQAAQGEIDRQEIVNLENEAARAIQLSNATFFRRVYSDDFTGTLSHGQPVNKASFIGIVQNPETKYASFIASDINVRTFQETAITTCLWSFRGTYKGNPIASQIRVLHVYVNTPRGWRVVASQATSLPPEVQQPL
jgi:ketosteroid isomerase-like protein